MKNKPVETELRLTATRTAFEGVIGARALAKAQVSPPVKLELKSIYWDTPQRSLQAAGVGLRTRWDGKSWVQTVKLATRANATRYEYETPLDDEHPRLSDALDAGAKLKRGLIAAADALEPVFASEVLRTVHRVTFADGTVAELAQDEGKIVIDRSSGAETSLCELELELKSGDVRRLYELAFELVTEISGLRLLVATKAERGYALLAGTSSGPRKARALATPRRCTAGELTVAAATEALAQLESNIDGSRTTLDPEYVHQLRVGLRRLRVTTLLAEAARLPTFSPRLDRELKWLWNLLGKARDWDVLETQIWPAIRVQAKMAGPRTDFEGRISRARRDAHRKLQQALDGRRFQRIVLALGWVIENQRAAGVAGKNRSVSRLGRTVLSKVRRRLCDRARDLGKLTAAERHRVRIQAKKMRYAAEFLADVYRRKQADRYLRRLAKVQSVLGDWNDLDTAVMLMQSIASSAAEKKLIGLWRVDVTAREQELRTRLDSTWKTFVATKPFWR